MENGMATGDMYGLRESYQYHGAPALQGLGFAWGSGLRVRGTGFPAPDSAVKVFGLPGFGDFELQFKESSTACFLEIWDFLHGSRIVKGLWLVSKAPEST